MKILWVADFGLQHNIGGAQRTDSFIIEEGKKRGHQIIPFNYNSDSSLLQDSYDMVVSGNLENLHRREDVFRFLLSHPFHVRYEHDSNSYLTSQSRKDLFTSTKYTFFLSDFHYETFKKEYGDYFSNVSIITSPIDIDKFKDFGGVRHPSILYVGFMHFLKGTNKFLEYALFNPDKNFVVAGWSHGGLYERMIKSIDNIQLLGKIEYEQMPVLFNTYEYIYYHPLKFEPFCRSIGEAILCGMKLDCSDNIGAIHTYNKYGIDEFRKMCTESPQKFWEIVDK